MGHGLLRVDGTVPELIKSTILGHITRRNTIRVDDERSNGCNPFDFMFPAKHNQSARYCQSEVTPCTLANSEISLTVTIQSSCVVVCLECKQNLLSG